MWEYAALLDCHQRLADAGERLLGVSTDAKCSPADVYAALASLGCALDERLAAAEAAAFDDVLTGNGAFSAAIYRLDAGYAELARDVATLLAASTPRRGEDGSEVLTHHVLNLLWRLGGVAEAEQELIAKQLALHTH